MSNPVPLLIALATARGGSSSSHAPGFLGNVWCCLVLSQILKSGDSREGLCRKSPQRRRHHRFKITTRINESVEEIRKLLLVHPDGPLVLSSYKALQSIAGTMSPGEEGSLTTGALIPPVLAAIRGRKMARLAITTLALLSYVPGLDILTAAGGEVYLRFSICTNCARRGIRFSRTSCLTFYFSVNLQDNNFDHGTGREWPFEMLPLPTEMIAPN
ncbi:hypothetical protein B0H17DRAFT_703498 [Mycena rosella]|uniref:Uncharacterized protein n=1 Tax=Mycena rosella TaxID=1033263 RepID=A0AAD7DAB0_MYCRO|nr:hypothetical protein B0H17DRAFT_703498 [Mycena rosella]